MVHVRIKVKKYYQLLLKRVIYKKYGAEQQVAARHVGHHAGQVQDDAPMGRELVIGPQDPTTCEDQRQEQRNQ